MAKKKNDAPEVADQEQFSANVSAQTRVAEVDAEAKKAAEEAGVKDAAFVGYDEALKRYEARSDVETLAARRAREGGVRFSDADHERKAGEDSGVVTAEETQPEADNQ